MQVIINHADHNFVPDSGIRLLMMTLSIGTNVQIEAIVVTRHSAYGNPRPRRARYPVFRCQEFREIDNCFAAELRV